MKTSSKTLAGIFQEEDIQRKKMGCPPLYSVHRLTSLRNTNIPLAEASATPTSADKRTAHIYIKGVPYI